MASRRAENAALFAKGRRRCKDCKRQRRLKFFYRMKRGGVIREGPGGYQHVCIDCMKKRSGKWQKKNYHRHQTYVVAWRKRHAGQ